MYVCMKVVHVSQNVAGVREREIEGEGYVYICVREIDVILATCTYKNNLHIHKTTD